MYYAKQNKSVREGQILHDFTHVWNLRSPTDEHGRGKKNNIKTERETNHKRLLNTEH